MRRDRRPPQRQLVTGLVIMTRGRNRRLAVVDERGLTYEMAARQGLQAFPGDRVRAEVEAARWMGRRGHPVMIARVTDVLERGRTPLLGTYHLSGKRAYVVPKEKEAIGPLEIGLKPGVHEGALIAVDLGRHPGVITPEIVGVWEDADAPRARIEQLIMERGLPREFPAEMLREAESFPEALPREEVERRMDLRKLEIVVIDPADAKDHDDAVSWEPDGHGGGRLGVHIADVSYYVRPGRPLDEEARARGVSCYLTDRVIPMLPERLSADLCSLIAGRDRLARSVFLDIDAAGRVRGAEAAETVIRASASLSYDEVWRVLEDPRAAHPHARTLRAMDELAQKVRALRFADGSLDFNFPEYKVRLDRNGEPEGVDKRVSNRAHQLIEEFMILANRQTGEQLDRQGTGIWRIHEPPGMDDVAELEEFLKGLGLKLRHGARSQDLRPKDFQAALARFKGTPEEYVVQRKVLQALRLAVYAEVNVGHFGLALKSYAHFTSPIRRYADLIAHRLTRPAPGEGNRPPERYSARHLGEIAAQTSDLERRAQEAEWACTKLMTLRLLAGRVGDTVPGTISRLERWGAFVELEGLGIDGLLRFEEVGFERYQLSRDGLSTRGRRSGRTFRVGERLNVVLVRIDREAGHLDLAEADA